MASQEQLNNLNSQLEDLNKRADALNADLDKKIAALNANKKKKAAEAAVQEKKYTLFASGFDYGGRGVDYDNKNTTTDLVIIFDVVDSHTYSRTVSKTQYATENKVTFADHAVIEDGKFSFSARITSSPQFIMDKNYIDKDTDTKNPVASKRPEKALNILNEIIDKRAVVTLITEDIILENYICTSMSAERSTEEGAALVFQLEFTEFRTFVLGKTVLASNFTDPKKSANKQKGAVGSSSTDKQRATYERKSDLHTDLGKSISSAAGLDDYTSSVQQSGTWDPSTGQLYDNNGNPIK